MEPSNILHAQGSDVWYTPMDIVDRARRVLGRIDLDPASDEAANTRVRATRYIDEAENGLTALWGQADTPLKVFLNPPGKKLDGKSMATHFWMRLVREWEAGVVEKAVFVAYSLEQLQTSQQTGSQSCGQFAMCVPSKRLAFEKPDVQPAPQATDESDEAYAKRLKKKNSPTHGNAIVYLPNKNDGMESCIKQFVDEFSAVGDILIPVRYFWLSSIQGTYAPRYGAHLLCEEPGNLGV